MTDVEERLRTALSELVPQRPAPADPYRLVAGGIARARARRRRTVLAGGAAGIVVTAVVVAFGAGGVLDHPHGHGSLAAGGSVQAVRAQGPAFDHLGNGPAGKAWVVGRGSVAGRSWTVVSSGIGNDRSACLLADDEVFQRFGICFDHWTPGQPADWTALSSVRPEVDAAAVAGFVPASARSVVVTFADGRSTVAAAVGTPTSSALRFFAVVVPGRREVVRTVVPLGADGGAVTPVLSAGAPIPPDPCRPSAAPENRVLRDSRGIARGVVACPSVG